MNKKGHCVARIRKFCIVIGSLSNDDGGAKDDGRSEKKIYLYFTNDFRNYLELFSKSSDLKSLLKLKMYVASDQFQSRIREFCRLGLIFSEKKRHLIISRCCSEEDGYEMSSSL